jgi:NADH-quinone oxidoreductase subunit L
MRFVIDHSYLIPLLPLLGAAIAGFFGLQYLKERSHWPIWITVGISAVLSLVLLFGMLAHVGHDDKPFAETDNWYTWIDTGAPEGPSPTAPDAATQQRFIAKAGALFDPLTAVMLAVVCGIGFLICVSAAGYMKGEEGYFRFFAYLGLFIFSMTCLVMGENLVMLFLGWEGVGLCSYLLIGYYYDKPSARDAAKKAFIVNRIGDFGFAIGILLTFLVFGTVSFFGEGVGGADGFLEMATSGGFLNGLPAWKRHLIDWIPFCLMLGAFGKSAQFPLYVWLPDAMEGPTPVSALIHAATMVTAGVYMIARCGTVFVGNHLAMSAVAAVGAFTAIFAATIALRQFDLKKVFAYSTVSQLGFMFVAVGLFAPVAGVFHLVTHAFFKALLFLSSGVVMHAMAGELDMRKMSGLRRVLPRTRLLMLIGCLALAGMVPLSGFWSKDEIVAAAFEKHTAAGNVIGTVLLFTAFLTAYYTFRLYFRVFEGPLVLPPDVEFGHVAHGHAASASGGAGQAPHASDHATASAAAVHAGTPHESGVDEHLATGAHDAHTHHDPEPPLMIYPLIALAVGAVLIGFVNTPWWHGLGNFLGHSPSFSYSFHVAAAVNQGADHPINPVPFGQHSDEHHPAWLWMFVSIVVSAGGIGLAYLLHLADRRRAEQIAAGIPAVARTLENKYWVDEIYNAAVVAPLRMTGRLFFMFDRFVVDSLVWLVSFVPQAGGWALKLGVQRGYLQGYAAVMLFGLAIILLVIFL